jgi:hypothetical protein
LLSQVSVDNCENFKSFLTFFEEYNYNF